MNAQEFIQRRFSGELNNDVEYMELLVQVFIVLVAGIVLWRLMVAFQRRKTAKRRQSSYFDNVYSKHWKKK